MFANHLLSFIHVLVFIILNVDQKLFVDSYDVIYNWTQLDYDFTFFPNQPQLQTAKNLKNFQADFIPQNNIITGIKVYGDRLFLSIPRWYFGVPATLVQLPYDDGDDNGTNFTFPSSPKLRPFPSWEMNEAGNCLAFQSVQSFEIDQFGRMWVMDMGRFDTFENVSNDQCPPKLIIVDLTIGDEAILWVHEFPENVVNRTSNNLNDIVVACHDNKEDCWAYMTDSNQARIIVYDFSQDRSWFAHHDSMVKDEGALNFDIDGQNYTFNTHSDGIALSPLDTNFDTLFYAPLSSYKLFAVPTAILKNGAQLAPVNETGGFDLVGDEVTEIGTKSSQADGMMIDAEGTLYFGGLTSHSIHSWNISMENLADQNQLLLEQNDEDLKWVDTFAMDQKGFVLATPNRLHKVQNFDFNQINFRVIRFFVGVRSYMFSNNEAIQIP